MSDTVIAAIITVGGMAGVVVFNELFYWFREKRQRTNAFFKDFFPERLKAYQEIARVITECGFDSLDPETVPFGETTKILEESSKRVETVAYSSRLLISERVFGALGNFFVNMLIACERLNEPIQPEDQFIDAVCLLQREYNELVKLLREETGVDIIDQEFAKALKGGGNVVKKEEKKFGKRVHGKKKRPC
jgi:hypothetical protein